MNKYSSATIRYYENESFFAIMLLLVGDCFKKTTFKTLSVYRSSTILNNSFIKSEPFPKTKRKTSFKDLIYQQSFIPNSNVSRKLIIFFYIEWLISLYILSRKGELYKNFSFLKWGILK